MIHHPLRLLLLLFMLWSGPAAADPALSPDGGHGSPIGRYTRFLVDSEGALTLEEAIAAYVAGRYSPATQEVLTFGIGAAPVWIQLAVDNPTADPVTQRLSVETAWLDRVDVYFRHGGQTVAAHRAGDRWPFGDRPLASRFFVFDHDFAPGRTDVFLRVQTPDPMVVPIYLASPQQARVAQQEQDYSYGFLYGFLLALIAYNLMLFTGLRDTRYLLYSCYLGAFLLMNASYTGHGFAWLWPNQLAWAQWSNPVLMVLYGLSGLAFALHFLDIRRHFPRLYLAVLGYGAAGAVFLLLAILAGRQHVALQIAFSFVFLFTWMMLVLGVVSVRAGVQAARYFLLAAFSAMIGAAVTALAVWGFIPFNQWTFRAVDIGMLLDATLLALALSYQFRLGQSERQRAELLARLDPLTGLNNRRAFYDLTVPLWNLAERHDGDLSVILLDIDHFKQINDTHGHAVGDRVLRAAAGILKRSVRAQDVAARWGGEEFIVLLPETDLREAALIAERLRAALADAILPLDGLDMAITASLGVAQRAGTHRGLDDLISCADRKLYESKDAGRNRVSCAAPPAPRAERACA